MPDNFYKKWTMIVLINFLIVLIMGALLRLLFFQPTLNISFKNLLHAHSHFALSGWVQMALMIALVGAFLPSASGIYKKYDIQLKFALYVALAIVISFLFFGYNWSSILLSILQLFLSYLFAIMFKKDLKSNKCNKSSISRKFLLAGLFFMIFSSLGPLGLGAIIANGHSGSKIYFLAIYFYLHFQYNGWFTFAIFALLFQWMENNNITYSKVDAKRFLFLLLLSCLPAYSLSTLWIDPPLWVNGIAGISGITQCFALFYLLKILSALKEQIKNITNKKLRIAGTLSIVFFILKILLQLFSALPYLALLTYKIRNFIIGYLHLVLIGFVSFFILQFLLQIYFTNIQKTKGLNMFIFGFIASEFIIFLQSTVIASGAKMHDYFQQSLFLLCLIMPLGFGFFLLQNRIFFNLHTICNKRKKADKKHLSE